MCTVAITPPPADYLALRILMCVTLAGSAACSDDESVPDAATATDATMGSDAAAVAPAPLLVHDGPIRSFAGFADWDPANPRPLLGYERLGDGWHQLGEILFVEQDGTMGNFSASDARVRIWAWESQPPGIVFDGLNGNEFMEWPNLAPVPLILLAKGAIDGSPTWFLVPGNIRSSGVLDVAAVEDRIVLFGWQDELPDLLYQGDANAAEISQWNPAQPPAFLALGRLTDGTWTLPLVVVADDGIVSTQPDLQDITIWGWR